MAFLHAPRLRDPRAHGPAYYGAIARRPARARRRRVHRRRRIRSVRPLNLARFADVLSSSCVDRREVDVAISGRTHPRHGEHRCDVPDGRWRPGWRPSRRALLRRRQGLQDRRPTDWLFVYTAHAAPTGSATRSRRTRLHRSGSGELQGQSVQRLDRPRRAETIGARLTAVRAIRLG